MKPPPDKIGNDAKVIFFTPIDERHEPTGACRHSHYKDGKQTVLPPASGLLICQYDGMKECYLFGCDSQWHVQSDTFHDSIEDAMEQAEFEYVGVSKTWTKKSKNRICS